MALLDCNQNITLSIFFFSLAVLRSCYLPLIFDTIPPSVAPTYAGIKRRTDESNDTPISKKQKKREESDDDFLDKYLGNATSREDCFQQ
jgi:hypothetical protein